MNILARSACAKIILLGEHAVVYGKPSIAVPFSTLRTFATIAASPVGSGFSITAVDLDNQLTVVDQQSQTVEDPLAVASWKMFELLGISPPDANISLHSNIPIASGMGSGAALTTALLRAILHIADRTLPNEKLNEIVYEIEKIHHGTPSGIDNTVIVYEKPVYFVRGLEPERLKVAHPFSLVIADTGVSASTKVAVSDVRKLYDNNRLVTQQLIDSIGELVLEGRQAIEGNHFVELGAIMNRNHELLKELTVSAPMLDKLVECARQAGALGAKLTGGGRGGNMICLVTPDVIGSVKSSLLANGAYRVYDTIVQ